MSVTKVALDSNGEIVESYSDYRGGNTHMSNLSPDETKTQTSVHADSGAIRVSINGNDTHVGRSNYQSVTKDEIVSREHTNILSTATNRQGMPLSRDEIRPESLVKHGDFELQAQHAEQIGLIKKGLDGKYYLPSDDVETRTSKQKLEDELKAGLKAQESEAEQPDIMDLPEEIENKVSNLAQTIHEAYIDGITNEVIAGSSIEELKLADVAYEHKLDSEALRGDIGVIRDSMQEQADAYITNQGIEDLEHFYDWINNNKRGETQNAMRNHFYQKNLSVYTPLIKAYQSTMNQKKKD